MESPCDVSARDTLARFIDSSGGDCTLNSYHPLMSTASTRTSEDGKLEECTVVQNDTSKRTHASIMNGVVYKPSHTGGRYCDAPFDQTCFGDPGAPLASIVHMPKALDVSGDHIIPQSDRQARNLPDADKWLAAAEEEMTTSNITRWLPIHPPIFLMGCLSSPPCSSMRWNGI